MERDKIVEKMMEIMLQNAQTQYPSPLVMKYVVKQILDLPELEEYYEDKLRKEGWKSPEEEITCPDCGIKHKLKEFIW
jgi:hypothetical protein